MSVSSAGTSSSFSSYHHAFHPQGPFLQAVNQAIQTGDWSAVESLYSSSNFEINDLLEGLRTANGSTDQAGHAWYVKVLQDEQTMGRLDNPQLYSLYWACVEPPNPKGAERFLMHADLRPLTNLQLLVIRSQIGSMDLLIQEKVNAARGQ